MSWGCQWLWVRNGEAEHSITVSEGVIRWAASWAKERKVTAAAGKPRASGEGTQLQLASKEEKELLPSPPPNARTYRVERMQAKQGQPGYLRCGSFTPLDGLHWGAAAVFSSASGVKQRWEQHIHFLALCLSISVPLALFLTQTMYLGSWLLPWALALLHGFFLCLANLLLPHQLALALPFVDLSCLAGSFWVCSWIELWTLVEGCMVVGPGISGEDYLVCNTWDKAFTPPVMCACESRIRTL